MNNAYTPRKPSRSRTIDVGAPWGIVARFHDVAALEARFLPQGMRFVVERLCTKAW